MAFEICFVHSGKFGLLENSSSLSNADQRKINIAREAAQERAARMRVRSSRKHFETGDRVIVRNIGTGLWDRTGTMIDEVKASDGVARNFVMRMDGDETEKADMLSIFIT